MFVYTKNLVCFIMLRQSPLLTRRKRHVDYKYRGFLSEFPQSQVKLSRLFHKTAVTNTQRPCSVNMRQGEKFDKSRRPQERLSEIVLGYGYPSN